MASNASLLSLQTLSFEPLIAGGLDHVLEPDPSVAGLELSAMELDPVALGMDLSMTGPDHVAFDSDLHMIISLDFHYQTRTLVRLAVYAGQAATITLAIQSSSQNYRPGRILQTVAS